MTSEEAKGWMVAIGTLLCGIGAMIAALSSRKKSNPEPPTAMSAPKRAMRRPIDKQIERQFCFMVFAATLGFICLMYWIGFASSADGSIVLISVVFWANILMCMVLFLVSFSRSCQLYEIRGVEIYKETQK